MDLSISSEDSSLWNDDSEPEVKESTPRVVERVNSINSLSRRNSERTLNTQPRRDNRLVMAGGPNFSSRSLEKSYSSSYLGSRRSPQSNRDIYPALTKNNYNNNDVDYASASTAAAAAVPDGAENNDNNAYERGQFGRNLGSQDKRFSQSVPNLSQLRAMASGESYNSELSPGLGLSSYVKSVRPPSKLMQNKIMSVVKTGGARHLVASDPQSPVSSGESISPNSAHSTRGFHNFNNNKNNNNDNDDVLQQKSPQGLKPLQKTFSSSSLRNKRNAVIEQQQEQKEEEKEEEEYEEQEQEQEQEQEEIIRSYNTKHSNNEPLFIQEEIPLMEPEMQKASISSPRKAMTGTTRKVSGNRGPASAMPYKSHQPTKTRTLKSPTNIYANQLEVPQKVYYNSNKPNYLGTCQKTKTKPWRPLKIDENVNKVVKPNYLKNRKDEQNNTQIEKKSYSSNYLYKSLKQNIDAEMKNISKLQNMAKKYNPETIFETEMDNNRTLDEIARYSAIINDSKVIIKKMDIELNTFQNIDEEEIAQRSQELIKYEINVSVKKDEVYKQLEQKMENLYTQINNINGVYSDNTADGEDTVDIIRKRKLSYDKLSAGKKQEQEAEPVQNMENAMSSPDLGVTEDPVKKKAMLYDVDTIRDLHSLLLASKFIDNSLLTVFNVDDSNSMEFDESDRIKKEKSRYEEGVDLGPEKTEEICEENENGDDDDDDENVNEEEAEEEISEKHNNESKLVKIPMITEYVEDMFTTFWALYIRTKKLKGKVKKITRAIDKKERIYAESEKKLNEMKTNIVNLDKIVTEIQDQIDHLENLSSQQEDINSKINEDFVESKKNYNIVLNKVNKLHRQDKSGSKRTLFLEKINFGYFDEVPDNMELSRPMKTAVITKTNEPDAKEEEQAKETDKLESPSGEIQVDDDIKLPLMRAISSQHKLKRHLEENDKIYEEVKDNNDSQNDNSNENGTDEFGNLKSDKLEVIRNENADDVVNPDTEENENVEKSDCEVQENNNDDDTNNIVPKQIEPQEQEQEQAQDQQQEQQEPEQTGEKENDEKEEEKVVEGETETPIAEPEEKKPEEEPTVEPVQETIATTEVAPEENEQPTPEQEQVPEEVVQNPEHNTEKPAENEEHEEVNNIKVEEEEKEENEAEVVEIPPEEQNNETENNNERNAE